MKLELAPDQPTEVAAAIAETLADPLPQPGSWWQAGIDEALRRDDGAPAQHSWGGPRVVEP